MKTIKGKVIQFRRGRHVIHERHFLIEVEGIKNRTEAEKFVGREVEWTSPGKNKKIIKGIVSGAHGNKGLIRARFEKGLPGQAVTTLVEIKGKDIKEEK